MKKTPKKIVGIDLENAVNAPVDAPLPTRALLTWPVLLSVANYALLSLLDIAYRAIQPLFYSTPIELGGLGQTPARIGILLALFGIMNGTVQALYFPTLIERWGPKRVFMTGMAMFSALFVLYPLINSIARENGMTPTVWVLAITQLIICIMCDMAYGTYCSSLIHLYEAHSLS